MWQDYAYISVLLSREIHMNDRNYSYRGSGTCISGRGVRDHIPEDILATTGRRSKMISLKRNVLVPSHNSIVLVYLYTSNISHKLLPTKFYINQSICTCTYSYHNNTPYGTVLTMHN